MFDVKFEKLKLYTELFMESWILFNKNSKYRNSSKKIQLYFDKKYF